MKWHPINWQRLQSMDECSIHVEFEAVNPPRPVGFGVARNGQPVAWLTLEQVEKALARYREMMAERAADSASATPDAPSPTPES